MKLIFTILFFVLISQFMYAQDIPEHISYTHIYDYLDELATDGIIQLNSVTKPYSRSIIADKLVEAQLQKDKLNNRQIKELDFYLNEFSLELKQLPSTHLTLLKNEHSRLAFIQPAYHYNDSLFRTRITPILGMDIIKNANGTITKRWYGAEIQAMFGKHLSVFGSLRDISFEGQLLARPQYLNDFQGCEYKESYSTAGGGDFSDSRGGINYSWKWGTVGLVKDNITWGDNYHGSNIISGRAPAFPMLTLYLHPVKWFEMKYFHGWLVSNQIDSTRYYVDNLNAKQYRMANKFMAANMLTFTPVPKLNISIGNSIIYAEANVQAAYFIPIAFYKSLDHTLTKGLAIENQNSQVFFNISSRNIKHLHLYSSVYIDEVKFDRFKASNPENNPISYKIGANVSNLLLKNISIVGEFTRTNIINYKHSIPVLTWASNSYNLGHYLGDNAQEMYVALRYKPTRGLDLNLSYSDAKKGNEYSYNRANILEIISQPVMNNVIWTNQSVGLNIQYEIFNNAYAVLNAVYSNIKAYNATSTRIDGEPTVRTATNYLNLYTPQFLQGKNTTITAGFSFGF